ncbi:MAG: hypothetical protein CVV47_08625 [Spirochaetae bacterium HGW-Spirochaetae-3]|jgi:hypothetical protein|nr:MAG: hypothetical protein CVV47_08625 [Spirochaetae bacterium HGW-Spirochaetae-3]
MVLSQAGCGSSLDAASSRRKSGAVTELEAQALADARAAEAAAAAAAAEAAAGTGAMTEEEKAAAERQAEAERIAAIDVPPPILSGPPQGVYAAGVTVSASVQQAEARLVYTLDGSAPVPGKGEEYTGPVSIPASAVLRIAAYVPGGKASRTVSAEYTIGEICAASGASGDGRRGAPMGDLAAALEKAVALGLPVVKLAAGSTFAGSLDIGAPIDLSGGWNRGFSARTGERSAIVGREFDGTTKKAPGYALRVSGAKANSGVRIERVEFRGGSASYSAGLVVADGATPSLVDCRAFGGDGSYGYGAAVLSGAAPSFRSCRLSGGDGATSYGLSVDSARATVASSFLLAGAGAVGGYGLSATDAAVKASSTVLAGNAANVSYGAAFYNCEESSLESCTAVGGSGKESAGVFISACNPAIEDCIVGAFGAAKSYGIIDNYGDSAPARLSSVVFVGCSGGLYYDADTKIAYAAVSATGGLAAPDGSAPAKPKATACAVGDFTLSAADDYATPRSAAMPQGKPLAGAAAIDVTGKARTAPWTIGAYEL